VAPLSYDCGWWQCPLRDARRAIARSYRGDSRGGRWWTLRGRRTSGTPPAPKTETALQQAKPLSPLTDSNRRPLLTMEVALCGRGLKRARFPLCLLGSMRSAVIRAIVLELPWPALSDPATAPKTCLQTLSVLTALNSTGRAGGASPMPATDRSHASLVSRACAHVFTNRTPMYVRLTSCRAIC